MTKACASVFKRTNLIILNFSCVEFYCYFANFFVTRLNCSEMTGFAVVKYFHY